MIAPSEPRAGDRTGITWPDTGTNALSAIYNFDVLQRVTSITANGAAVASYSYDSVGRRSGVSRNGGAGASTSYQYDGADRLRVLTQSLAGRGAVSWTLGYDPASGLVSAQASNTSYLWHPGAGAATYTANGLNQYPTITPGGSSSYDAQGNMTADPASGNTFGYDALNRLASAGASAAWRPPSG